MIIRLLSVMKLTDNIFPILDYKGSKMKVVLIIPNFDSYLVAPQLGILYLSAYLKKHGINTVIIEGLRDNLTCEEILERIKQENPDIVGIHCLTGF